MQTRPFYVHEANLELPEETQDLSVNMFTFPNNDGTVQGALTITRHPAAELSASDHMNRFLAERQNQFPKFEVLEHRELVISGMPSAELKLRATLPDKTAEYLIAMFTSGGRIVSMTLTYDATAAGTFTPAWEHLLETIAIRP